MTDLRIGSLCSGYGGLDLAVMDVLGGSVAWHCQYEPPDKDGKPDKWQYAARILEHHWPSVLNLGDIAAVDWSRVERRPGRQPQRHAASADRDAADPEGERYGYARASCERGLPPAAVSGASADADSSGRGSDQSDLRARQPHPGGRVFIPSVARGVAPNAPGDGRDERRAESAGLVGGSDAAVCGEWAPPDSHGGGLAGDPELHVGQEARLQASRRNDAVGRVLDWGQYGPAIGRWERVLGRPAPNPVGDRGRLSPRFVEWMMGLPEGHVCDVPAPEGMSEAGLRNARLKALGNGVVPQQAAYALRLLLERVASEEVA